MSYLHIRYVELSLCSDAFKMESRLNTIIEKVDNFKDRYMFDEPPGLDAYSNVEICFEDEKSDKIAEYSKQQQFLERKLASLNKDIESLTVEKESLRNRANELTQASDVIKNTMSEKLANLKAELSRNHESSMSKLPGTLEISVLLNLITNIDWNVEGCNDSKIKGYLVSRSLLKQFSFDLNTHKPHEIQEKLWDILDDGGFLQSLDT